MRQVRVAALPYEMPNRLVPKVGEDTFMVGSDWPHAEGVADPMLAAERAVAGLNDRARREPPRCQRGLVARAVTIDLDARAAERERLRATYLREPPARPPSTARGIHHLALLSSDVERTICFYQNLLGFPLVELFENRDYQGSTHFFFDLGHDNALAFFDFPGLDLGPYTEVLGGFHHLAISVDRAQWEAARTRLADAAVATRKLRARSASTRRPRWGQARAHCRRPGFALWQTAALMAVTGLANLAVKVREADLEAACAWYEAAGATVTAPVQWENGRRADVQLGVLALTLFTQAIYEDACRLPDEGFLHPALFVDDLDAELARHTVLWGPRVVSGSFGTRRIAFVEAPGGIRLEFMEQIEDPPG